MMFSLKLTGGITGDISLLITLHRPEFCFQRKTEQGLDGALFSLLLPRILESHSSVKNRLTNSGVNMIGAEIA